MSLICAQLVRVFNCMKTDIAIIGGGLAGLYLAYLCEKQGVDYRLFEAQARLGGRIFSNSSELEAERGFDLGPTWFWPHQNKIQELVNQLNLTTYEQYTRGDALYQLHEGAPAQRTAGAPVMQSFRIIGGMARLIDALVGHVDMNKIHLTQAVSQLERNQDESEGGWSLTFDRNGIEHNLHSKKIIVATPPRIAVQQFSLDQSLPKTLIEKLKSVPTWMAAQAKFVATYEKPFWRASGLSGEVFSRVGPLVEVHDASADVDSHYALFGFVGMPANAREQFSGDALKQLCLRQLVAVFGEAASQVQNIYFKDWAKDPWITTAQDINDMPEHPYINLQAYQSTLVDIGLFFAGTEYASNQSEAGYLEGALCSAERAFKIMT